MASARRVVILGGGVSGLATAHALLGLSDANGARDITVIERSARLGGNIATEHHDGFVLDGGPDSWVATKPHGTALAKSLGLGERLIPTVADNRRVYIAARDGLCPLPEGVVLGVPTEILPIVQTPLFSWDAKLRMALEPLIPPRRWEGDDDESIGDFVARRLGDEVADRLAGPLLGGIFAGDARELSVRAAFPQFVDAEKNYGSLVRAMRAMRAARKANASKGEGSAFFSLQGGLGELVDALEAKVASGARVRTGVGARRIEARAAGGYRVVLDGGEVLDADDVVVTLPLPVASTVTHSLDSTLGDALAQFDVASTATVFLAYHRRAILHPLDATGFLVPRSLGRAALASTWVSSKWSHRAPEGDVLLRVFFGGATGEEVLSHDDAELATLARRDLRALMGIEAEPMFARVFRFDGASPQPRIGHLARVRAVSTRLARWPGVYVTTNGFGGSGIPDCVKNAEAVAASIAASHDPMPGRAQNPGDVAIARGA
jgi:oxygen-dependent protoporphyrinogen oxidase